MSVRAVTPRVPALHGMVHRHDCAGDCCNWDRFTDDLATGEDIYTSDEEIPAGRGLRRYAHLFPPVGARLSPPARAGQPSHPLG